MRRGCGTSDGDEVVECELLDSGVDQPVADEVRPGVADVQLGAGDAE